MNKTQLYRRQDICQILIDEYQSKRLTLCWSDFYELTKPRATELCQQAYDEGITWSKSKGNKVFNAALTVSYDAFRGGVFLW